MKRSPFLAGSLLAAVALLGLGLAYQQISRLRDLTDVSLPASPTANDYLRYVGGVWTNAAVSGSGLGDVLYTDFNQTQFSTNSGVHLKSGALATNLSVNVQTNTDLTASALVYTDTAKKLSSVTIGSGLDLTTGTLSATGSGSGPTNTFNSDQFALVNGTNVNVKSFALVTNLLAEGGSYAAPAYGFSAETNSGLVGFGGGQMALAAAGKNALSLAQNAATFGTNTFGFLTLSGVTNSTGGIIFQGHSLDRWHIERFGAENGTSVGSDLYFSAYDDDGAYLNSPLIITRVGAITVDRPTIFTGNITNDALSASALVYSDANKKLSSATIDGALSFAGGILSGTGQPASANLTNFSLLTTNAFHRVVAGTNITAQTNNGAVTINATRVGLVRNVWIDAGAMVASTTNGAATGTYAPTGSADNPTMDVYDFDDTTSESVQFKWSMPDEWNRGTIKAKFYCVSTNSTNAAMFGLSAATVRHDDPLNPYALFGSAQFSTNTITAANDLSISPATAAITLSGTPALGNLIMFNLLRTPASAGDTLVGDARLIGVSIQYTESTTEPAAW